MTLGHSGNYCFCTIILSYFFILDKTIETQVKQISFFFVVKAVTVYCSEFSVSFLLSLAFHKPFMYSLELSKTSLLWRQ